MSESSSEQSSLDDKLNNEEFEWTLRLANDALLCEFLKKVISSKENEFFETTCISSNMFERIIHLCRFFTSNPKLVYKVTHLMDRFYDAHLERTRTEYDQACEDPNFEVKNSWQDVLDRIRHQMPLRIVVGIFTVLKYDSRSDESTINDCLAVLGKVDYYCSAEKFKKSQRRLMRNVSYNLETLTMVDCVTVLMTILKNNLENLNCDFYHPHIYSVINLIYSNEFRANDKKLDTNHVRSLVFYGALVLILVPVLVNHPDSYQITVELIDMTKPSIKGDDLLTLRVKFLNLIMNKDQHPME